MSLYLKSISKYEKLKAKLWSEREPGSMLSNPFKIITFPCRDWDV